MYLDVFLIFFNIFYNYLLLLLLLRFDNEDTFCLTFDLIFPVDFDNIDPRVFITEALDPFDLVGIELYSTVPIVLIDGLDASDFDAITSNTVLMLSNADSTFETDPVLDMEPGGYSDLDIKVEYAVGYAELDIADGFAELDIAELDIGLDIAELDIGLDIAELDIGMDIAELDIGLDIAELFAD